MCYHIFQIGQLAKLGILTGFRLLSLKFMNEMLPVNELNMRVLSMLVLRCIPSKEDGKNTKAQHISICVVFISCFVK